MTQRTITNTGTIVQDLTTSGQGKLNVNLSGDISVNTTTGAVAVQKINSTVPSTVATSAYLSASANGGITGSGSDKWTQFSAYDAGHGTSYFGSSTSAYGTPGTLVGVTATTTSGSTTIGLSSGHGLSTGQYIKIAGVPLQFCLATVGATSATVVVAPAASVTNAAVSYAYYSDPHVIMGYNFGQVLATEPDIHFNIEADFMEGDGRKTELYWSWSDNNILPSTERRPFYMQFNRDTGDHVFTDIDCGTLGLSIGCPHFGSSVGGYYVALFKRDGITFTQALTAQGISAHDLSTTYGAVIGGDTSVGGALTVKGSYEYLYSGSTLCGTWYFNGSNRLSFTASSAGGGLPLSIVNTPLLVADSDTFASGYWGRITLMDSTNSTQGMTIVNRSNGISAGAGFYLMNDSYANGLGAQVSLNGSGTAPGIKNPNALVMNNQLNGGVRLIAAHTDGDIGLLTGGSSSGNFRFYINSSGAVCFGSYNTGLPGTIAIKGLTTEPTSNQADGGGFLWVKDGALKYRGSSGTVTTIAVA